MTTRLRMTLISFQSPRKENDAPSMSRTISAQQYIPAPEDSSLWKSVNSSLPKKRTLPEINGIPSSSSPPSDQTETSSSSPVPTPKARPPQKPGICGASQSPTSDSKSIPTPPITPINAPPTSPQNTVTNDSSGPGSILKITAGQYRLSPTSNTIEPGHELAKVDISCNNKASLEEVHTPTSPAAQDGASSTAGMAKKRNDLLLQQPGHSSQNSVKARNPTATTLDQAPEAIMILLDSKTAAWEIRKVTMLFERMKD